MKKKITINMVADRAGVSRGTVDRVLHQRPHVRKELYDKVVRAMKDLDYRPDKEDQAAALGLVVNGSENCGRIGIILPSWQGYFRQEIYRGIEDGRKLLEAGGYGLLVRECQSDLPREVTDLMDELEAEGAGGIALCAMDHSLVAARVRSSVERGLPVVTYNSDLTASGRQCFVGQQPRGSGRVAGSLMSRMIPKGKGSHILIAIGNPAYHGHRQRVEGFQERMAEAGFCLDQMELVETYNDYMLSYQKVKEKVEKDDRIQGIYMANHSVDGCLDALAELGGKEDILVISHDLTETSRKYLLEGSLDFVISQDLYGQGFQSLLLLEEYLKRGEMHLTEAGKKMEIICRDHLDEGGAL